MGKSTMSMAIFNSYVKLPEGNKGQHPQMAEQFSLVKYECYPDLETINQKRHAELSDMFSGFLTFLLGCLCIHGLYRGRGPQVGDLASASSRAMVVVWCDVSIDEAWPREKHKKNLQNALLRKNGRYWVQNMAKYKKKTRLGRESKIHLHVEPICAIVNCTKAYLWQNMQDCSGEVHVVLKKKVDIILFVRHKWWQSNVYYEAWGCTTVVFPCDCVAVVHSFESKESLKAQHQFRMDY